MLGAGVAGLAAAADLAKAGVDVLVLEARGRVGGRVFTARDARTPLPVELGAEFLHGAAPATRAISSAAQLPVVSLGGSHWWQRDGRLEPIVGFDGRLEAAMTAAFRRVRRGPDRSFADAIRAARVAPGVRAIGCSFVEGFNAAASDRISARALARGGGAESLARIVTGYDAVPAWLASRLPDGALRASTIVTEVRWRRSDVRVACHSGAGGPVGPLRARKAIVTLPLAVLALRPGEAGAVRFEPDPAPQRRAIGKLAMGSVLRLTLRFREAFWRSGSVAPASRRAELGSMSFLHAPRAPIATWWTTHPIETSLLTAWAGGPAAAALLARGETCVLAEAVSSLAHVFRRSRAFVEERLDGWFFHDWSADPFTRGAYSYPVVGGAAAARLLATRLEGTLFFAGEATAMPPDNGTVHGAIASGRRAAREVLDSLSPAGRR